MNGYGLVTRAALSDFGKRSSPFNGHMWMSLWQMYAPKAHMGYGTPDAVLGKCHESAGLAERLQRYPDQAEKHK